MSGMLKRTDKLGAAIEQSAGKRIEKVLFCNSCKKDVWYDKGGTNQVNQHALSSKHKKSWQSLQPDPNLQTTFKTTGDNIQLSKPLNMSVIEAEILWLYKIAEEDCCFASRDHFDKLFARMFKDCNVAEMLGIGHTKSSYCV